MLKFSTFFRKHFIYLFICHFQIILNVNVFIMLECTVGLRYMYFIIIARLILINLNVIERHHLYTTDQLNYS